MGLPDHHRNVPIGSLAGAMIGIIVGALVGPMILAGLIGDAGSSALFAVLFGGAGYGISELLGWRHSVRGNRPIG